MAITEYELQRAAYTLNNITIKYNFKISVNKPKAMTVQGDVNVRTKRVINNNISEQVTSTKYVEYTITVSNDRYLKIKMNRFNRMCSII
jgi:hypothetical protein